MALWMPSSGYVGPHLGEGYTSSTTSHTGGVSSLAVHTWEFSSPLIPLELAAHVYGGRGGYEGDLKNWLIKCFLALNHEGPRVARAPTVPLHAKVSHATCATIWEEVATFPAPTSEYSLGAGT